MTKSFKPVFFNLLSTSKDLIPLKYLGFFALPMTNNFGFLVLDIFAPTIIIMRSLPYSPPEHSLPFNIKILSGKNLKNKPVSSILKISLEE